MSRKAPLPTALRTLRGKAGIDQTELWERSGVHRSSISQYENGATEPGLETLGKLLGAMGMDFHDLQDVLDEVNGRQPRVRAAATQPDAAALARLRLTYPGARQELLVERAILERQMRDALDRVEEIQLELDVHERRRAAGKPPIDLETKVRTVLAETLGLLHPEWSKEEAEQEALRRLQAEVVADAER